MEKEMAGIVSVNVTRRRNLRFVFLPAAVLTLCTFLLLWKPHLATLASDRLSSLKDLSHHTLGRNETTSRWNDKGGKAGFFQSDAQPTQWGSEDAQDWWAKYSQIIVDGQPNFDEIKFKDGTSSRPMAAYTYVDQWTKREQRLQMTSEELDEVGQKHNSTRSRLEEIASKMPYKPGTRGIVMTTAVDAMAFLTVSLRMLRKTGTTLPVEIWMFDVYQWNVDPWGLRMCAEVWAPLGATCHFVADHIPKGQLPPYDKPTEKYMNKFDAMMFSSFEQIIFLDSDNNALMPLDDLFDKPPFSNHGMVLWPDYWKDWTSPYFYQITGAPEPTILDRASTESGQVMINKRSHALALLMASYYGRYQSHYIRLLEQVQGGEGDKETFLHAASAVGLPFYQIAQQPDRLGYRCNGNERPIASAQHHPEDDYYLSQLGIHRGHQGELLNDGTKPRVLFVHGNLPKYDPGAYLRWRQEGHWEDQLRCDNGKGKAHRMWGDHGLTLLKHGWDAEKALWDQMRWVACQTEHLEVAWWIGTWNHGWEKWEHVCEDFTAFYEELIGERGEGQTYNPSLIPAPFDPDGEFAVRAKQGGNPAWRDVLTSWEGDAKA